MRNIAKATQCYQRLRDGARFDEISQELGTPKRRLQQMIHLAFLAPEIVRQITLGTQPVGLTSDWLVRHSLPTNWTAQQERITHL